MTAPPNKEGTLGFLTYLLVAGAIAIMFVLGGALVGSDLVQDRVAFPSMGEAIDDGTAFTIAMVAFLVVLPLLVAGVSALFGRRAGMTGQSLRGASSLNALVGVPISFIVVAAGLLVLSIVAGEDGQRSAFNGVMDLVLEGFLFMLIGLGPLVGFAALVTHVTQQVFAREGAGGHVHTAAHEHADHGHHHHMAPQSHETGDVPAHEHVHQVHVDCPRCGTEFTAEGERPLRIACPNCGKSGTLQ